MNEALGAGLGMDYVVINGDLVTGSSDREILHGTSRDRSVCNRRYG